MADPAIEHKKADEGFPRDRRGFWQPERGTAPPSPIFSWPPRPLAAIKWLYGYLFPWNLIYMSIATLTWLYWQPALARCVEFRWDWMMEMFVRNEIMLITITSAWHIRLWSQKNQGMKYKFTTDWMAVGNRKFLRGSQLGENVLWTLISGVTWTGYEIVMMWAYANDMLPYIDPRQEPIYFGILLCSIVMWRQLHFYWSHRITHWPPLYKTAHYLHHRNINIGPWSGLSMHPLEHIIYFSCILLHWVVPSHPIHMLMNAQHAAFAPSQGHVGFEKLKLPGDIDLAAGNYFHQLHHRYFECNYGGPEVPFDAWFGTYHDGSAELHPPCVTDERQPTTSLPRPINGWYPFAINLRLRAHTKRPSMSADRIYDPDVEKIASTFPRFDVTDAPGTRTVLENFKSALTADGILRPSDENIEEIERSIPGPDGALDIPIRIYMPRDRSEAGPGFVNFHGGGFLLGDLETEHPRCLKMATDGGAVSVGVDYRLAPENPFPAGVEDCYTALKWVVANVEDLKIDPSRIAIGGASAGGNLTAAVALMARDRGGPDVALQMLIYPVIDDRCDTPSMKGGQDCYIWNSQNSLDMWDHYIGKDRSNVSPYAAPARAEDLSGLPPAYMMTCEHDPLRDEAIHYAMRLMDAGVTVDLHNYPGTVHGFDFLTPSDISTRAINEGVDVFIRAVAT